MAKPFNSIVVLGPTASGKTRLGVRLAARFNGEIISADSRQVYRRLDIGSGKDLSEYEINGEKIPYHLIDVSDVEEEYSVFDFQKSFFEVFPKILKRGSVPIVVGGTGLYLESVLDPEYRFVEAPGDPSLRAELASMTDEELLDRLRRLRPHPHNVTDSQDRSRLMRAIEIEEISRRSRSLVRPDIHPIILGAKWDRKILRDRISARLKDRLRSGLIEEVRELHESHRISWERLDQLGLECRFVGGFLRGEIKNKNDLFQKLFSSILQFAKRQETWFRRMEKKGFEIHWIPEADLDCAIDVVMSYGERDSSQIS